jgi:hypothetical protein
MYFQGPDHGSVSRDCAFVNGSGRQHRDYAKEIRVILPPSQAANIDHHLSILSSFDSSYPGQPCSGHCWLFPVLLWDS